MTAPAPPDLVRCRIAVADGVAIYDHGFLVAVVPDPGTAARLAHLIHVHGLAAVPDTCEGLT